MPRYSHAASKRVCALKWELSHGRYRHFHKKGTPYGSPKTEYRVYSMLRVRRKGGRGESRKFRTIIHFATELLYALNTAS